MEDQPRFGKFLAYAFIPVAASLGVGVWLANRIQSDPSAEAQAMRTEEVIAQDRLLIDALWSAIETVKARALGLQQVRHAQSTMTSRLAPEGAVLHWAELEVKGGKLAGVRQSAANATFHPSAGAEAFESFYLQAALAKLNLHELQENGVTVLRIKQDAGRSQEWLALGFAGAVLDPAAPLATDGSSTVVLALVDPAEVFPIFRRWTSRSEGGNLRGYLVGSDGYVIAHSQHPYEGSDFAATPVFDQGVRELLRGQLRSGAGVYRAIDQVAVTAAYARPGTLPLGAVVERVNPRVETKALASAWLAVSRAPEPAMQALVALLALVVGSALATRQQVKHAKKDRADTPRLAPPVEAEPALYPTVSSGEGFTDFSPDTSAASYPQFAQQDQIEGALVQAQISERILLAQFDTETLNAKDPKVVAGQLVEKASRLAQAPALFFGYHDTLKACLLKSHAGLPASASTQALSFRLTDAMLARITRYQKDSRTASLADDANLALLLAKRLGVRSFEAWPVIGAEGKLLGVLAVLVARPEQPRSDGLAQLMKASGPLYERLNRSNHDA